MSEDIKQKKRNKPRRPEMQENWERMEDLRLQEERLEKEPPGPGGYAAEMVRRVQDYKPAMGEFDYTERGRAVTEAHQLYNESFQLLKIYSMAPGLAEATTKAHRLWFEAIEKAYPFGFWRITKNSNRAMPQGWKVPFAF